MGYNNVQQAMNFLTIKNTFFFSFLILSTLLFFYILTPFLYTIFWASVLAILFYPLYKKILVKTKGRANLSALLSLLSVLFVIIIPLVFGSFLLSKEFLKIKDNLTYQNTEKILQQIPGKRYLEESALSLGLDLKKVQESLLENGKKFLKNMAISSVQIGKNALSFLISFFITLYLLFFFFRDGEKILAKISRILPLGQKIEQKLFERFSLIIKSIFKGSLLIALVQTTIATFALFLVGFNSLALWAFVIFLLSLVPAVGPALVLFPMILFLFFTNQIFFALLLLAAMILVSTVDNILRPILVGRDTKIPDIVITLCIFGGLANFGVSGLIIGPIIAGVFITFWSLYEERYSKSLDEN